MLSYRGDFLVQDRAARVIQAAWKTLKRGVNPLDREKIVSAVHRREFCSISHEPLGSDTSVTPCGHLFKEDHLNEWLRDHSNCPLCLQDIVEPQRRPLDIGNLPVVQVAGGNPPPPNPLYDLIPPIQPLLANFSPSANNLLTKTTHEILAEFMTPSLEMMTLSLEMMTPSPFYSSFTETVMPQEMRSFEDFVVQLSEPEEEETD